MPKTKGDDTKQSRGRRALAEIDEKQFNALCALQCTITEIAAVLGVDTKTLMLWCKQEHGKSFSQLFKERRSAGFVSLRRSQFELAKAGNPSMLIWLGKNYLGQTDNGPMDDSENEHVPTQIIFESYDASKQDTDNEIAE